MTRSSRSNGVDVQTDARLPMASRALGASLGALTTPMHALDAFRAMLDASWSASARLWTASEDFHRLQSMALDAAAKAISKAAADAEYARDVQDLWKVQVQFANSTLEQTATLSREWLNRLISMSSELTPPSTIAQTTARRSVPAVTNGRTDGSTIWPTDLPFNAQTAWSEWAQQLARTVNRGVMPS